MRFFSLFLAPVAGLIVYAAGLSGLGLGSWYGLCDRAFHPAAGAEKKIPPSYARAIARIKFGKYKDAELEVLHELRNARRISMAG